MSELPILAVVEFLTFVDPLGRPLRPLLATAEAAVDDSPGTNTKVLALTFAAAAAASSPRGKAWVRTQKVGAEGELVPCLKDGIELMN
ncbi:hypothetical protein BGZ80_006089 [Entomortierella chlamydospora]|uniref:Uncharacterized protein n=1 Tax=Entomortierella chlamydospora TaxID=101097 RepID=A0A9P6T546_9FUNG|nr:hypothetical protein BGZ79_000848 [Entomortierella chlamydospora]KAG0024080.1 hypothetical protein BGZ80_006089 [Entomortierella chlamydospora]